LILIANKDSPKTMWSPFRHPSGAEGENGVKNGQECFEDNELQSPHIVCAENGPRFRFIVKADNVVQGGHCLAKRWEERMSIVWQDDGAKSGPLSCKTMGAKGGRLSWKTIVGQGGPLSWKTIEARAGHCLGK
jgi:hypothetical protein